MSADFTLYIYRIRAAILIPTRTQTIVPAAVQETLFAVTLGLTFLHVFIWTSHVLEQRSVVICDVCWKPPRNQLLIKLSLLFVVDYCARELSGTLDAICLGQAWSTPLWSTTLLYFAFCSAGIYKSSKCKHEILTSDKKIYPEIHSNYSAVCVHLPSSSFVTLKHMSLSLLHVLIVVIIITTQFTA